MPTVAEIAAAALDGVSAAIPDAVHAAILTREVQGTYDTSTGSYSTTEDLQAGRMVVDTSRPASDIFPEYEIGPADELILLEGFTSCQPGDELSRAGKAWEIQQSQDILSAGSLFYVIGRISA